MGNKIKDRIKALLSKTIENGATKEEMESALSKANQLMRDFFISEHDLVDRETINKCISKQFPINKSGYDFSIFYGSLSNLFDCKCFFNKNHITFFGHETDVDLCGYFYNLITKTCLSEKDKYQKSKSYMDLKRSYNGKTLTASFIKGFLIEVTLKMNKLYENRKSNIPESYSLMVIEKKEKVENEFNELNLNLNKKRMNPIKAEEKAFNDGKDSGSKLNIIQGINQKVDDNKFYLNA